MPYCIVSSASRTERIMWMRNQENSKFQLLKPQLFTSIVVQKWPSGAMIDGRSRDTLYPMKKILLALTLLCLSCGEQTQNKKMTNEESLSKVKLMTLDPGHFHAALVHKTMYPQVDSTIYVFAPEGPEVKDFLNKIEQYNTRARIPYRLECGNLFRP